MYFQIIFWQNFSMIMKAIFFDLFIRFLSLLILTNLKKFIWTLWRFLEKIAIYRLELIFIFRRHDEFCLILMTWCFVGNVFVRIICYTLKWPNRRFYLFLVLEGLLFLFLHLIQFFNWYYTYRWFLRSIIQMFLFPFENYSSNILVYFFFDFKIVEGRMF